MLKKLIQATVATAMIATPMIAASAEAQTRHTTTTVQHRPNGTVVKKTTVTRAPTYRTWRKGQRFDRRYAQNYRVVDYRQYRQRRLYAPPRGYQWVRSGNDAVLIGVTSGIVSAVLSGALR